MVKCNNNFIKSKYGHFFVPYISHTCFDDKGKRVFLLLKI
jgi:hypothetical protein